MALDDDGSGRAQRADALAQQAIEALQQVENLLVRFGRPGVRAQLQQLIELIDELPDLQLNIRMARIRLQAQLRSDPDKTPAKPPSVHDLRLKP